MDGAAFPAQGMKDLVTCPEGAVHVLYQGELEAGRFLRTKIPVPAAGLRGMVTITATFCYATQTDPQDPLNYTRAGLEVVFRPHHKGNSPRPNAVRSKKTCVEILLFVRRLPDRGSAAPRRTQMGAVHEGVGARPGDDP